MVYTLPETMSTIFNAISGCAAAILSVHASQPHTVRNCSSHLENNNNITV